MARRMIFTISQTQSHSLRVAAKTHRLDLVILYGSATRGNSISSDSDIDIAVFRHGGIGSDEYLSIANDIQSVFSGKTIDVKMLHNISPLFRFEVMRSGSLLFGDPTLFQELYLYSYRDYQESRPLYSALSIIGDKRQQQLSAGL